jgi:hypothetical protein
VRGGESRAWADEILFGDQKDCDGVVFDGKGWGLFAEHVFLPRREAQDEASLESLILKAVEHKARKGAALCQGQDAHHGQMVPNPATRRIAGKHHFDAVRVMHLEKRTGRDATSTWSKAGSIKGRCARVDRGHRG